MTLRQYYKQNPLELLTVLPYLLGIILIWAMPQPASADVQTIQVTNYSNYGSGSVCVVNPMFNGLFDMLNSNLSTNHTSKSDAIILTTFFDGGVQRGECRDIRADGSARIDAPDSNPVNVVVIVTNGGEGRSATIVYWNVYKIDGSVAERITVNP